MQCHHISYYRINDLIKSLKKYKNHLNIYTCHTLLKQKKWLKKGYYMNEGLGLAWDSKAHFLCVFRCTKFYDF